MRNRALILPVLLALLTVATELQAAVQPLPEVRARLAYDPLEKEFATQTNSLTAAWQFSRACFDVAEYATNSSERALLAEKGIAASERGLSLNATSAPAMYYLGMNLGQLARTRGIGALKVIQRMEAAFLRARQWDPEFDYGGPDRNLGLLYREAPSLISLGSRKKAKQHFEAAITHAPTYPENRLNLIETYLAWNDWNGTLREYKALQERWAEDLAGFRDPKWQAEVQDWHARYQKITKRVEHPPKPFRAPKA